MKQVVKPNGKNIGFNRRYFGEIRFERLMVAAVQCKIILGLTLSSLFEKLRIPTVTFDFQKQVKKIIVTAHSKREQSQALYSQAEKLLLETIGLKDFQPSQENKNIKKISESFLAMGRLDA